MVLGFIMRFFGRGFLRMSLYGFTRVLKHFVEVLHECDVDPEL